MSRTVRVKAVTRVANCAVAIESPMQLACERVGQGKIQVDEVIEERTFAHFGIEGPVTVAVIDEDWCIGCTLCIAACPTDAIVGVAKRMHTVVEPYCTGCELCLPVCPVDCISLDIVSGERTGWQAWTAGQAQQGRTRYNERQARLLREQQENEARLEAKARAKLADLAAHSKITDEAVLDKKRAVIEAALARSRARRENPSG